MKNPFVYDRPNTIEVDEFIKYYITDNTYTRFLESTRNIVLIGVRGSGKTSTLRYYSLPVSFHNPDIQDKFKLIGVHIPCKQPLLGKREYLLYDDQNKQNVVVEHFLCINILTEICNTFLELNSEISIPAEIKDDILANLGYIFDTELKNGSSLFDSIKLFINKEANSSQRKLNNEKFESFIDYAFTFNNTIIPLLEQLKKIPELSYSHFSLFFDDIQDLGDTHQRIINSWIAFRDNKLFSFKIATAATKPIYITSTGGIILEGHDFVRIDLTKGLFNKNSEFSQFAKDVIQKRLDIANIKTTVDDFLPISDTFKDDLEKGKQKARELAEKKYPNPTGTQISDYVAKYARAISFRERNVKANIPTYSGFETIVDISTGVIRNLLNPLYFMYEKEISQDIECESILTIQPNNQKEIIKNKSDEFWEKIRNIDSELDNCSKDLAKQINNFYNQLIDYLRRRLKDEKISEPRALNFIISEVEPEMEEKINEIIDASLKSTLLYERTISHKATGKKLPLYVPNRLMLPTHGLDPHGQYSHFPIKGKDFLAAAINNKPLPFFAEEESNINQLKMDL
jgi:DNA polymerase III delta prime subunit